MMDLDKAKNVVEAYEQHNKLVRALEATERPDEGGEYTGEVRVGIGRLCSSYGYPSVAVRIDRDLVTRMLEHALARAKSRIEAVGGIAPPS